MNKYSVFEEQNMDLVIILYQEKADKAIDDMLKARDQYETTKSGI